MNASYIDNAAVVVARAGTPGIGGSEVDRIEGASKVYETRNGICCLTYNPEYILDRSTITIARQKAQYMNR